MRIFEGKSIAWWVVVWILWRKNHLSSMTIRKRFLPDWVQAFDQVWKERNGLNCGQVLAGERAELLNRYVHIKSKRDCISTVPPFLFFMIFFQAVPEFIYHFAEAGDVHCRKCLEQTALGKRPFSQVQGILPAELLDAVSAGLVGLLIA